MVVKLGDLLLKAKLVTQEQVDAALKSQREEGGKMGEALVRVGAVTENDITETLSQQFGVPSIDLASFEIDMDEITGVEAGADVDVVKGEEGEEIDLIDLAKSSESAPIIKLSNLILIEALKAGASDIHVEPYEKEFRVRFRVDGILHNIMALPMRTRDPLISRLKIMAKLDISEKRLPQDGRIKIRLRVEERSRDLDLRVSSVPTQFGEKVVMRLLDKSKLQLDMTQLGFDQEPLRRFKDAIDRPYGIVL